MRIFMKNDMTRKKDVPAEAVQLLAEGWTEQTGKKPEPEQKLAGKGGK